VTVGKESPKERWDTHLALVLKHDVVVVRAFFKMAAEEEDTARFELAGI